MTDLSRLGVPGIGVPAKRVLLAFQCPGCGTVTTDLVPLGACRVEPNACTNPRCDGLAHPPRLSQVVPV